MMDNLGYLINEHLKSKNIFDENPPWVIRKSNLDGRGLFANRDIQPGETIFKDSPLIIGPRVSNLCPATCVNCCGFINLYACSKKCGLPVCSENCENSSLHKNECQIIGRWSNGCEFDKINREMLKCLTPIRSLFLNDNQNNLFKFLKSHSGPKHGLEVDIIKEKLQLNISEEEEHLLRLNCLVLDANSFEVTVGNKENQMCLKGLFPLSSLMNHNCVPNTMHIFDSNQDMVVKAAVFIPEGQEMFDSYTRRYWGTPARRLYLTLTKNFYCMCARCEDPTEFGTNLSAINCLKCQGLVLPFYVENEKIIWKCVSCNGEMPGGKAGMIISVLGATLNSFRSSDPEDILAFLKRKLVKHLPSCSQIAMELKYKLVWILGYRQRYLWKDLSEELLDEKEDICRELLQLLTTLGAGRSKMRGLLLYELYCCLRERQRRLRLQEVDVKNESFVEDKSREMEELFHESREILTDDVHAPAEIKQYNLGINEKAIQSGEIILAG